MNYKIIGGDQKEYGPVTLEQLREWLREGRVNTQTPIQAEGATEWKPLSSFPEVAGLQPSLAPASGPAPGVDAQAAVKTPAILLMVAGGLGVIGALFGIAQHMFHLALPQSQMMPPNVPPEIVRLLAFTNSLPVNLLSLGLDLVVLFGAFSMMSLRRWGLALAACIIAMACGSCSCCCPIGLAAGIWGIIQLVKPEVKAAFK